MATSQLIEPRDRGLVRVPASSANLGPAFDCAAIALDRHLELAFGPRGERSTVVSYFGPGKSESREAPVGPTDLALQGARAVARHVGVDLLPIDMEIRSDIPIGVGLGSSAALTVAGMVAAQTLLGVRLEEAELIGLAASIEGHPDNAAAALRGGLVCCVELNGGRVLTLKRRLAEGISLVVAVPARPLATSRARASLPASYPRHDAVFNLQRAVMLFAALSGELSELRPELLEDRLHQPYRQALLPGLRDCLELRHPALLGVFLSGAGSSVVALCSGAVAEIERLMIGALRASGTIATSLRLTVCNQGAELLAGEGWR